MLREENMIVTCPHCNKQLKFSDKFKDNLQGLKPGQKAKIKCTKCGEPFAIDSTMLGKGGGQQPGSLKVSPPEPPDVSWLEEGVYEDSDVVEEIPLALVMVPEVNGRDEVIKAVEGLGYRAEVAKSGKAAMEKMEFVNYASVMLHDDFEPGGLESGTFYAYLRNMNMAKRRYIFVALIGKDMNTLYDLQALSHSANIVVNDNDVKYLGVILRKAIPDYENLFGPLMEEMRIYGK